jgi:hypothetical protein
MCMMACWLFLGGAPDEELLRGDGGDLVCEGWAIEGMGRPARQLYVG